MENREKVIKGLHYCKNPFLGCKDCPYFRESDSKALCECKLKTDAFNMLKEQEPVKAIRVKGYVPPVQSIYKYKCENCESFMLSEQPFCAGCGRPVKWDD